MLSQEGREVITRRGEKLPEGRKEIISQKGEQKRSPRGREGDLLWGRTEILSCAGERGDLPQGRKEVLTQRGESCDRPGGEKLCSPGVENRSAILVGGELRYSAGGGKSNALSGGEKLSSSEWWKRDVLPKGRREYFPQKNG